MLLDLLIQTSRGRQVSVQGACLASGAAETTALRHLALLVGAGEVIRTADPGDRRRCWLHLSPAGEARLLGYLAESARLG